jgi:plastocyanin
MRIPIVLQESRLLAVVALLAVIGCGGDASGPGGSNVAEVAISAPTVNGLPRTAIGVGDVIQLTATPKDQAGNELRNVSLRWVSSLETVATVSPSGQVTGVSGGATVIQAIVVGNEEMFGSLGIVVQGAGQAAAVVNMPGDTFSPQTVTIRVNERVAFAFPARAHNVIFVKGRAGLPQDIQQTANVIVQRQFTTVGNFPYDCTLHPGMSGEVVVRN